MLNCNTNVIPRLSGKGKGQPLQAKTTEKAKCVNLTKKGGSWWRRGFKLEQASGLRKENQTLLVVPCGFFPLCLKFFFLPQAFMPHTSWSLTIWQLTIYVNSSVVATTFENFLPDHNLFVGCLMLFDCLVLCGKICLEFPQEKKG